MFWQQTPRVNQSCIKGAIARIDREHRSGIILARWAGAFAQYDVKGHDKLLASLLDGAKKRPAMTGKQIGAAMRSLMTRAA